MLATTQRLFKQLLNDWRSRPHFAVSEKRVRLVVPGVLILAVLACGTNTPAVSVATARPTRTPFPTFTLTPVPPTSTPRSADTSTPIYTDTPVPSDTPAPTDTPTNTPVPPTNTAAPPANTPPPAPTPTPLPVAQSPLSTPTSTPEPDTPPGRYDHDIKNGSNNCAHIAVLGRVVQRDGKAPIPYVWFQVKGDRSKYKGPYIGRSDQDGYYTIVITELRDDVDGVEFDIEVVGDNADSEDYHWEVGSDCHDDNDIQVLELTWKRKNL